MDTEPPRAPSPVPGGVVLRDVEEEDIPIFFEHQREPDANQMAAFPPRDRDAHDAHWTRILRNEAVTTKTILFGGRVAGNIGSWVMDGKREVGYWIGKAYWGKGVATRALAEFLKQVHERPLYAHVAKHNLASIRLLQKCGFTIRSEEKVHSHVVVDEVEEVLFDLRL